MEREDFVDSPEHNLRDDTDVRQDATMHAYKFDKAYTNTVYHSGIRWGGKE
jgi:hypothetical protein